MVLSYSNTYTNQTLRIVIVLVFVNFLSVMCYSDEDYENHNSDQYSTNHMVDDLPIFYRYGDVMARLEKEAEHDFEKVDSINGTYHKDCRFGPDVEPPEGRRRPFIVIEGNHRHSRDVVGIKLARRLGGRLLKVPPKCLGMLSTTLPASSDIRRVFFGLCVYATSYNVKQLLNIGVPVVLNGYWTDQAAFVIEKRFDEPPPVGHSLYQFPKDLFPPDLVFYLNKDESGQHGEVEQRHAPIWKQRTIDIYKKFENPNVHIVDMQAGFYQAVDMISTTMNDLLGEKREMSYNPPRYLDPRYF